VVLRENYGFNLARLRRIKAFLLAHRHTICSAWERMHGIV
jgi:hypothetical protein